MSTEFVQFDSTTRKQLEPTIPATMAGAGGVVVNGGGIANIQTSATSNAADSTDDTLHTYTLPANTLGATGARRVRVRGYGTTGGNANTKTAKVWFGSASVSFGAASTATSVKPWYFEADIDYVAHTAQNILVRSNWAGAETAVQVTATTQDETTALVIKSTGASSASSAADVTENTFSVEVFN